MAVGLGIDAGGTATRWLLLHDNIEIARGQLETITGHLYTPEDRERNVSRLENLFSRVLAIAKPDAVVGGLTGLYPNTDAALELNQLASEHLEIPLSKVNLTSDMHIAYACAFEPGQGVIIYAGTGSVGYFEDTNGQILRSGGSGYLLDDAGAAFWIGQRGIQQVMRQMDETGRSSKTILAHEIYSIIGNNSWEAIIECIYSGDPRTILAKLSPAVTRAAERHDITAIHILENAGQELARLAKDILNRLEKPLPVAFMGGMSQASSILDKSLQQALPHGVLLSKVTTEPVIAAARLALRMGVVGSS
jgi:N-acetylglucosamine kinase-like BadF-type ATPase